MTINAYADLNKTANTNNMGFASVVSDNVSMTEQTIKVLDFELRIDPNGSPLHNNTEGYSYTVEISSPEGEKTVREIFMRTGRGGLNYDKLKYVHPDAAGDKFYDPMSPPKFTDEVISEEIKEALKVAEDLTPQEMKNYDLGPKARARLAARVGSKAHHAPKPN